MSLEPTPKQKEFINAYAKQGTGALELFDRCFGKLPPSRDDIFYINQGLKKHDLYISADGGKDVYFVRCTETGRVKIGISDNPENRLRMLQSTSPTILKLEATIEWGGKELEERFHNKHKEHRLHREWFDGSDGILEDIDFINNYKLENAHR